MAAIAEPPTEEQVREGRGETKPKQQPPYAVVVHNDDDHTARFVIEVLVKVFKYELKKCVTLTLQVHQTGQAIVWSGSKEVAELKRDQILTFKTDPYASKNVAYPLRVTIEPQP
jgi:ATP-dependent Clp protease adaptor protein ClpS